MIKLKVKSPVARYLAKAIPESGKTEREIAVALGYNPMRSNYISMIRNGSSKLPLNKVKLMAEAIGGDPVFLLRLALQEYAPDTYKVISEVLDARGSIHSAGEVQVVDMMRKEAKELNVEFEPEEIERIRVVVKAAAKRTRDDLNKNRRFDHSKREWTNTQHGKLETV